MSKFIGNTFESKRKCPIASWSINSIRNGINKEVNTRFSQYRPTDQMEFNRFLIQSFNFQVQPTISISKYQQNSKYKNNECGSMYLLSIIIHNLIHIRVPLSIEFEPKLDLEFIHYFSVVIVIYFFDMDFSPFLFYIFLWRNSAYFHI